MRFENQFSKHDIVTSASGVIALLNEEETSLKLFGLEKLNAIVDVYWPELADSIFKIEELCEDEDFVGRELANLLASKIYFHLEKYSEALKYALCAGKLFNIKEKSQYVETMLAKCIEKYVEIREMQYDIDYNNQHNINDGITNNNDIFNAYNNNDLVELNSHNELLNKETDIFRFDINNEINQKMELLVDEMIDVCIKSNDIKEALGVALDARRLDKVEYIIANAENKIEILAHSINNEKHINMNKSFRNEYFKLLVNLYLSLSEEELKTEYINLCECLYYIDDYKKVAEILLKLLHNYHLMAYQISFDLVDFENKIFLRNILGQIKENLIQNKAYYFGEEYFVTTPQEENNDADNKENESNAITNEQQDENNNEKEDKDNNDGKNPEHNDDNNKPNDNLRNDEPTYNNNDDKAINDGNDNDNNNNNNINNNNNNNNNIVEDVLKYISKKHIFYNKMKKLLYILTGKVTGNLYIEFLHRNNHADLILLDTYKNIVDSRSSITHHGIVIAHALMQTGTTCDVFLRSNIEWLSKAINWAKFSATASLGVVYKGHVNESFMVLSTHLPYNDVSTEIANNINVGLAPSGVYSEGGSLYALGLIHANYNTNDKKVKNYLMSQLKSNMNDEVLQHGCCLGLGLVCLGDSNDENTYDELKAILYSDSAVAGESAAYAIGLLKLGSGDDKCIDELLAYAHDTQHEKITRACSISLGFVMFQKEREADSLIEELVSDKDAIIRYGGMFAIAMAYCGLSNCNKHIIKKLLHFSVSDVSDDVRRAAVIALGFVLCNSPNQVPKFLNLLIESYNPHVRYGAALALGIACSATANEEAINMLMPLLTDTTDFVRQSAFISLGLIFQQSNEHCNPNFKKYKEEIMKILSDKHEDIIAKFGAIVSAGLLDICGRNAISTFFTRRGNIIRPQAAAGFCLFSQLWYWFPLIHMISLTFMPTCLIGLTEDLKVPKNFSILSTSNNQNFDYPSFLSKEKTQEKKETVTAVLSTTAKRKTLKLKKQKNDSKITKERTAQDDNSSVLSDGKSMKNLEILSTAATIGQSSHVSHAESVEGSANDENSHDHAQDGSNISNVQKGKKSEAKSKSGANENSNNNTVDMKNPCRVIKMQEKYIEYIPNSRYIPVLPTRKSGFIMLNDITPLEPSECIEINFEETSKKEAPPFEPFSWKEEN
ncbi:hypothetical protein PFNF135_05608 [Plasmodium falciparum NF135/5.C10]|uniref:Uncharacterized protein n=1 Tax=Plasmodium falciparum NF135/5.C10 TaxID=1036726 RepID=W4I799_PLAFA|nr:hypothetical protein PFNF135_05608 [Plasmodium falciparum NF135/5.C10]